jgi:hypothetical protein
MGTSYEYDRAVTFTSTMNGFGALSSKASVNAVKAKAMMRKDRHKEEAMAHKSRMDENTTLMIPRRQDSLNTQDTFVLQVKYSFK